MITDADNSLPYAPTGCLVYIFTVRINTDTQINAGENILPRFRGENKLDEEAVFAESVNALKQRLKKERRKRLACFWIGNY